jgi:AcrR family transcriptional regulator
LSEAVARRAVERSVADRQAAYAREMDRIIEATYRVIERMETLDPTLRDILRESGLSTQAFYRYFSSKDELLVVLLDDGRRTLRGYLAHKMDQVTEPEARVRAWIQGVLAQAADQAAADRTRPFVANEARLAEAFPEEHAASRELLLEPLISAIEEMPRAVRPKRGGGRRGGGRRDAEAVYQLAFGTLHSHLIRRTAPTEAEVAHLVQFALRALGAAGALG